MEQLVSVFNHDVEITHPELISTTDLSHVLFHTTQCGKLSVQDLPSESFPKTILDQKIITLPSSKSLYAIYTYELEPTLRGATTAYRWLKKALEQYQGDTTKPLYWILCKGLYHFAHEKNPPNGYARFALNGLLKSYFDAAVQFVQGKPKIVHELYEQFRRIYYSHLAENISSLDEKFFQSMQQDLGSGATIKRLNYDFDNRLRMVFLYQVTYSRSDTNVQDLIDTVKGFGGVYVEPHKRAANTHYVIGPPFQSPVLGHFQYASNLDFPLCVPADLQIRMISTPLLLGKMNIKKLLIKPSPSAGPLYQLRGVWINVNSTTPNDSIPSWTITPLLEQTIVRSQQYHPYTMNQITQLVIDYLLLSRFLQYYEDFVRGRSMTISLLKNHIAYIRSQFAFKTTKLPPVQRTELYQTRVLPWINQIIQQYQTYHRHSPFVKLLEQHRMKQEKWNSMLSTGKISSDIHKYQMQVLTKDYTQDYWTMLSKMWIHMQELHLQCERSNLDPNQIAQRQMWIRDMVQKHFVENPQDMQNYIQTDFGQFKTTTFLRNFLPRAIASPYIDQFKHQVRVLQTKTLLLESDPIQQVRLTLQLRNSYKELENLILQRTISETIESPAPVFIYAQ